MHVERHRDSILLRNNVFRKYTGLIIFLRMFVPYTLSSLSDLVSSGSLSAVTATSGVEEKVVSGTTGQWLRFNDVLVDEFSLSDIAVEAECFGGTYKAKTNDCEYICSIAP